MIDARLRRYLDPPLDLAAAWISKTSVTANGITMGGFLTGLLAIPLLAMHAYGFALFVMAANRLADGLDGAIARRTTVSDRGAYLDIVLDFIFYAAMVFGFCLARPADAVYGAFLIFSFFASGATFLGYAIFAERRNLTTDIRGKKSIYYLGGLTEGFETIAAFTLMCLIPRLFPVISVIFGTMCWITGVMRIIWAWQTLAPVSERS